MKRCPVMEPRAADREGAMVANPEGKMMRWLQLVIGFILVNFSLIFPQKFARFLGTSSLINLSSMISLDEISSKTCTIQGSIWLRIPKIGRPSAHFRNLSEDKSRQGGCSEMVWILLSKS